VESKTPRFCKKPEITRPFRFQAGINLRGTTDGSKKKKHFGDFVGKTFIGRQAKGTAENFSVQVGLAKFRIWPLFAAAAPLQILSSKKNNMGWEPARF